MLFYSAVVLILASYIGYVAISGFLQGHVRFPDRTRQVFVEKIASPGAFWSCVLFYAAVSASLGFKAVQWSINAFRELTGVPRRSRKSPTRGRDEAL
jgi:hypothetical protein